MLFFISEDPTGNVIKWLRFWHESFTLPAVMHRHIGTHLKQKGYVLSRAGWERCPANGDSYSDNTCHFKNHIFQPQGSEVQGKALVTLSSDKCCRLLHAQAFGVFFNWFLQCQLHFKKPAQEYAYTKMTVIELFETTYRYSGQSVYLSWSLSILKV